MKPRHKFPPTTSSAAITFPSSFSSSSSRPVLSCTIRLVSLSLIGLIVVYLYVVWSFLFLTTSAPSSLQSTSPLPWSFSSPLIFNDTSTSIDDHATKTAVVVKADATTTTTTTTTSSTKTTIGIASTVTSCGDDPFIDGAAVLKYSLDILPSSKYDYRMYILYHPNATSCVQPLQQLGFTLLERDTPVRPDEIQGEVLRERIVRNGCCGELELIKLEAFNLIQHPVVIHIDLDTLILKPLDGLIDLMLDNDRRVILDTDIHTDVVAEAFSISSDKGGNIQRKEVESNFNGSSVPDNVPIMWRDKPIPDYVSLLFTKDYNVVAPRRHDKPYQGGFFMIKPSVDTYNEFVEIVRKGDYHEKGGWGKKVGPFYGGMTIQGLLPWYYEYVRPGQSVELNRCIVNNMNDKPKLEDKARKIDRCRTNEETCEDCRMTSDGDVMTFHFTICQKPWNCLSLGSNNPSFRLCRAMNYRWFELRSELESSWGRNGTGSGNFKFDRYRGYCHGNDLSGYETIQRPYGLPIQ